MDSAKTKTLMGQNQMEVSTREHEVRQLPTWFASLVHQNHVNRIYSNRRTQQQDMSPESSRKLVAKLGTGLKTTILLAPRREVSLALKASPPCYNDGFKSRLMNNLSTILAQSLLKSLVMTAHVSNARRMIRTRE
jgi:hypothetical protein